MQVSQSAEAKIPPPRSPLPLTTADYCSVSVSVNTHRHVLHTRVCMQRSAEQVEQLTGILQTLWLTFSKAGVMLLSFIDI